MLAFVLIFLCFASCGSFSLESGLPASEAALSAPEISADGWPDTVPESVAYIACDFSLPCDPKSGAFVISGESGSAPTVEPLWCDGNRRLMLCPESLAPGKMKLKLSGYRTPDGKSFSGVEREFIIGAASPQVLPDRTPPVVLSQIPRDQDFEVPPSLARIAIRFNKSVDLDSIEYSLSDGRNEIPVTLDRGVRFTDLFVLTIREGLKPDNCYIVTLMGTRDTFGNLLPIHILLFATTAGTEPDAQTGLVHHLVISEICHGGYKGGTANDEFIELYNPGLECVDLAQGFRLYRASASGKAELLCDFSKEAHFASATPPANFLIPPQGFFLISNESAMAGLRATADALIVKSRATLTANNSIWLTRNSTPEQSEGVIDLVGYGLAAAYEGIKAAPDPGSGKSLERKARADSTTESMSPDGRDALRGNALDRDRNADDLCIRLQPEPQGRRSAYEDWNR
ncbi:MAG: hypothetical protein LBC99_01175 [Spirochaetota bacterium]|jgi:hypothetical protein|nr:hypothetical protein [Spirochaetota bacterium]